MKNLFLLFLLGLAFPLIAEETVAEQPAVESTIEFTETSVTPDYLTAKADSDAVDVGVVEFVTVSKANEAESEEEEEEDDSFGPAFLAGPAEVVASLSIPLAFTGLGAFAGLYPASVNYGGMAVTPLTTTLGAAVGAVSGAVFTPYLALKGLFDTFTLGAFMEDEFDIEDHTVFMEDQVDNINEIFLLNNPFEEDDEDEAEDEGAEDDDDESSDENGTAEEEEPEAE